MGRDLTPKERRFLEIFARVAESYGEHTYEDYLWSSKAALAGIVESRDESNLEYFQNNFLASGEKYLKFSIVVDYPREISLENYNFQFSSDVHPETQAETAIRYLMNAWRWYCKKKDLPSSNLVRSVRANIFQEGDPRLISPLHLQVGIDSALANPSTILDFLVWFNQEWCTDIAITSRFDITLNNRPDLDFQISLTPSVFGEIQVLDGNF